MLYKSFLPDPALREFVRNYTIIDFQFNSGQPPPVKQRSPKAEQKIVFYIKGFVNIPGAQGAITPPAVAVYSHQQERRLLQVSATFLALVIYLRPGVLHKLIKLPMSGFPSGCADAELFFGTDVRLVREQLAGADSLWSMISIAEQFLLPKFRSSIARSPIDIVADRLLNDPTSFSVDEMAEHSCLSTRQFHRRFVEQIGISPKFFSRLCRFNHAFRFKLRHPGVSWSSIAQEYSYTDYHHLEKEFKSFIGLTPEEWIQAELQAPERMLKLR